LLLPALLFMPLIQRLMLLPRVPWWLLLLPRLLCPPLLLLLWLLLLLLLLLWLLLCRRMPVNSSRGRLWL
jgi:hypothetical protein